MATWPGPRNLLQYKVTGGVFGRDAPGITLASSATQSGRSTGFPTAAVSDSLWARGPLRNGPLSWKPIQGAAFPLASRNGATSHNSARLAGTCVVTPFVEMLQTSFAAPKSFGTVTVK